jgi:hypothetical protein
VTADRVGVTAIRPSPTPEEVAAIVAAVEAMWPRPVAPHPPETAAPPLWRFSGRSWWRSGGWSRGPIGARLTR